MDTGIFKKELSKEPELKKDFGIPQFSKWVEAAEKMLKGGKYKDLNSVTQDGVVIEPVYYSGNTRNLYSGESYPDGSPFIERVKRKTDGNFFAWAACRHWFEKDPQKLNNKILKNSETLNEPLYIEFSNVFNGSKSLTETNGVVVSNLDDFNILLEGIDKNERGFIFNTGNKFSEIYSLLKLHIEKEKIPPNSLDAYLNADPLRIFVETYGKYESINNSFKKMIAVANDSIANKTGLKIAGVSTLPYFNSGCSASLEIAFAVGTAVEYIETLKRGGIAPVRVIPDMIFSFGAHTDFFTEIAKLRAFRVLWHNICEVYGAAGESENSVIHSFVTPLRFSKKDPHVNILRATTSALSAVIGGASFLTVFPFDIGSKTPSELSKRVAENIPRILGEESMQKKVVDPSAGSYYIETITTELCEKGLQLFLEIENQGGMIEAVKKGFVKEIIDKNRREEEKQLEEGLKKIVGVNSFEAGDIVGKRKSEQVEEDDEFADTKKGEKKIAQRKSEILFEKLAKEFNRGDSDFLRTVDQLYEIGSPMEEISRVLRDIPPKIEMNIFPEVMRYAEKFEGEK